MAEFSVGRTHELRLAVTEDMTADRYGNVGVFVLATPTLAALFEQCAIALLAPGLGEGEATVGTRLDLRHLAATPVGMAVTIQARLAEVDGRRAVVELTARDEIEEVATCRHERFVVPLAKFLAKVAQKG